MVRWIDINMTIFSVSYLKLVFFLSLKKFNDFLLNWYFYYLFNTLQFYRPINFYKFFFFFITALFSFAPKYFYFILNKAGFIYVSIPFNFNKAFFIFLFNNILLHYNSLVDLVTVDYPQRKLRFELSYNLLSLSTLFKLNKRLGASSDYFSLQSVRLFVRTHLKEFQFIDSLSFLYNSSSWLERKSWDFFGIFFLNNLNLRRIFTDYGFVGYPLRKDFPLAGYYELYYDDLDRIIYVEPVEFTQELRLFNFLSPWESQSFLA